MTLFSHRAHEDPAQEAAQLLTRLGLFLLFMVSPAAPAVSGRTIYVLLPIGAALLLSGAAVSPATRNKTRPLLQLLTAPPVLASAFLVAWAGLSLAWSPFSAGPAERLLKSVLTLALVAVSGGLLPQRTRVCDMNLLPIGAFVAAAALAVVAILGLDKNHPPTLEELVDGSAVARAGVALALILWPAAGALALRGRWGFAAALVLGASSAAYASGAPNVGPALIAGLLAFAASFGRVRGTARLFGWAAAGMILGAPLVATLARYAPGGHASDFMRALDIWGALAVNGGARTLTGHGFGAAHFGLFGGYLDPHTPRSLLFQIWFDFGIVGAAAFAFGAFRTFAVVGGLRPALAPFLIAGLVAGFVIATLGPAAEQLWAVTAAGLDAIAFVLVMRGQFRRRRPSLPKGLRPRVDSIMFGDEDDGAGLDSAAFRPSE
ncbi:MAG TPA: hypothetical protein VK446_15905 [Methylocystis sp.]|nr:hypothetical protein [Methylocystis sp.]